MDCLYYGIFIIKHDSKGEISTPSRQLFTGISIISLFPSCMILGAIGNIKIITIIIPAIIAVSYVVYKSHLIVPQFLSWCRNTLYQLADKTKILRIREKILDFIEKRNIRLPKIKIIKHRKLLIKCGILFGFLVAIIYTNGYGHYIVDIFPNFLAISLISILFIMIFLSIRSNSDLQEIRGIYKHRFSIFSILLISYVVGLGALFFNSIWIGMIFLLGLIITINTIIPNRKEIKKRVIQIKNNRKLLIFVKKTGLLRLYHRITKIKLPKINISSRKLKYYLKICSRMRLMKVLLLQI